MPPPAHAGPASRPELLAHSIQGFLADHPHAAILEDGRLLFDLRLAHCSITADHGRCLLHLWSDERNTVRTISAIQPRRDTLRLETHRFGQSKPQTLTLVPDPDFRTPTARDTARRRYLRTLEQALATHFAGWTSDGFRSAMDLEHSFGPAYARGTLSKGQSAWAIIGVGPEEPPAIIDGVLTLGILWLDYCRQHANGRRLFHGLRIVVPQGFVATTRARLAWMNPALAQWELYELDSSADLTPSPLGEDGNLAIQLPQAFDPQAALDRSSTAIAHLKSLLGPGLLAATEIRPRGATEVGFSLHGLQYARIRHGLVPGSFMHKDEIFFGAGPSETALDETTEDLFRDLTDRLFQGRHAAAATSDPLFRLQPERWLESVLRRDLSVLDPTLGAGPVYSQLFASASASRTLLDLVTVTQPGRLAILELKADDDLHLPLQALDYWTRIRMLHRAGEITRRGYFPGVELSPEAPLLTCVAPALHIHPANETVFRAFAPAVPWELIAIDEHWRNDCRVLLRKHSATS
ncbi:MAG TPA: hypothetical protein VHZ25_13280 [Acidobacteriaceae bacterium]|jgi:hypothetical protein|nr:hypothetical protein [Acidobacteriaceae bacterium]